MILFLGDEFVAEEQASVSVDDRGLLFGDGVFETALLCDGGFFRLHEHLQRFAASAAMLRIRHPPIPGIERIARDLVRRNGIADGNLRVTLTRGVHQPTLIVTLRPPDPAASERAGRGWRIITAGARRPSTAAVPAQLKALGRTWAILARFEARDAGVDDALLLNERDDVCEGPAWNVFWRTGRTLFTPAPAAGVLRGVTRGIILELAEAAGYDVHEGLFPRADLDHADEAFATMTSVGIVSIRALDGRELPDVSAARDLRGLYLARLATDVAADAAAHPP